MKVAQQLQLRRKHTGRILEDYAFQCIYASIRNALNSACVQVPPQPGPRDVGCEPFHRRGAAGPNPGHIGWMAEHQEARPGKGMPRAAAGRRTIGWVTPVARPGL